MRSRIGDTQKNPKTGEVVPYRSQSFSKRAAKGKLVGVEFDCPYCHHNKALKTVPELGDGILKCAKCKRYLQ